MVTHMLEALSEPAKAWKGPYGSDIPIALETKLGRSVVGANSIRLLPSWGQISGTHCTIFSENQGATWYLEDTSTNGTFINQVKVPKKLRQPLSEGDQVRFSQAPDNDPAHIIEFVFKRATRMFGSHTSKQASAPGKRIRGTGSQGVSQANGDGKRLKKAGPEPNAEVMKENADYKRINSDLMKRCSTLETAMQEHRSSLQAERLVRERAQAEIALEKEAHARALREQEERWAGDLQQMRISSLEAIAERDAADGRAGAAAAENLELVAKLAEVSASQEQTAAALAVIQDEHARLQAEHQQLQQQLQEARQSEAASKAEVTKLQPELEQLQQKLLQQLQAGQEAEAQLQTSRSELEAERDGRQAEGVKAAAVREQLQAAASIREASARDLAAAQAELSEVRGDLDRKRRDWQDVQEENKQLQQQLETKISMLQSVRAKFQAERRAANIAYEQAQHYLAEVNQHHANSTALCEELDEQLRYTLGAPKNGQRHELQPAHSTDNRTAVVSGTNEQPARTASIRGTSQGRAGSRGSAHQQQWGQPTQLAASQQQWPTQMPTQVPTQLAGPTTVPHGQLAHQPPANMQAHAENAAIKQQTALQQEEPTLAMPGEPTQVHPAGAARRESQGDSLPMPMQIDRQRDASMPASDEDNDEDHNSYDGSEASGGADDAQADVPELTLEDTQEHEQPGAGSPNPDAPSPAGRFAQIQNDTYDEFAGIE
ncbi:hypothetical protein WJX84_005224 [Apatococcus fuscideae]|uniref:FHA domain-containing protein n=1 Tax=Apatococcus fuscideae TaxID=2026836 RepID=A0AAW1T1I3_9CHLO